MLHANPPTPISAQNSSEESAARQLAEAEEYRQRLEILYSTVDISKPFCRLPDCGPVEPDGDAEEASGYSLDFWVDAYLPHDAQQAAGVSDAPHAALGSGSPTMELRNMLESAWIQEDEPKFGETFEEKCRSRATEIEQRIGAKVPPVVARGSPPTQYTCAACGKRAGYDVQTPDDVFQVAYRVGGWELAIESIKEMAVMLEAGNYHGVTERTACCRTAHCMLAQNRLSLENYELWFFSSQRQQLTVGTDRKDQGLRFGDSIIFLRCLAVQKPPILTKPQLRALWKWVVANAQFIQEREKNFIATALAVVEGGAEGCKIFGYTFADNESFLNRMATFPRRYFERVMFRHILDTQLSPSRWRSGANRLLETAMPKPADVVYALMCEDNWDKRGQPRDASGRRSHCVDKNSGLANLFSHHGYEAAIRAAVDANATYHLSYANSEATNVAGAGNTSRRELQQIQQAMTGTHKRPYAIAHGKAAPATCASMQKQSGVHPNERYAAIAKAEGMSDEEAAEWIHLFVDHHANNNSVGFEKDPKEGKGSKACTVLRAVKEIEPPKKMRAATKARQDAQFRCDALLAVGRKQVGI
jgi:hypothetical protein